MPKLARADSDGVVRVRINANCIVSGSNKLTDEQKEALPVPAALKIIVIDPDEPETILATAEGEYTEFNPNAKTGLSSTGYKIQATFEVG